MCIDPNEEVAAPDIQAERRAIDEAKNSLAALVEKLKEIEKASRNKLNIFHAVGMRTQEIRHSAFFAWLLDPQRPHGLGNEFLCRFLNQVLLRENPPTYQNVPPNRVILARIGVHALEDLADFYSDAELEVRTERTLTGNHRRTDIYIESQAAKIVLVIENKVFTTTHDEQLKEYGTELRNIDEGWRGIFVYLTPEGDVPTDNGEPNPDWCILSYSEILQIAKDILAAHSKEFRKKQFVRVKLLLEDYIEMVNFEILDKNREIYALCKQIRRDHADAIEILMRYSDNVNDVYRFCSDWVQTELKDRLENIRTGERQCAFITKPVADFFRRKECPLVLAGERYAFTCAISAKDGPIVALAGLETESGNWSDAQKQIACAVEHRSEIRDRKYHRLFTVVLLEEEDRRKTIEEVSETLKDRLQDFLGKLSRLEIQLIGMP